MKHVSIRWFFLPAADTIVGGVEHKIDGMIAVKLGCWDQINKEESEGREEAVKKYGWMKQGRSGSYCEKKFNYVEGNWTVKSVATHIWQELSPFPQTSQFHW